MAVSSGDGVDSDTDEVAEAVVDLKEMVALQQQQIGELTGKQARRLPLKPYPFAQHAPVLTRAPRCAVGRACASAQARAEDEISTLKMTVAELQATVNTLVASSPPKPSTNDVVEVKKEPETVATPAKRKAPQEPSRLARAAAKKRAAASE